MSQSWLHVFLIAKVKTLAKKLFVSPSRKRDEKEKKKKTRKTIAKLFALHANSIKEFDTVF